MSIETMTLATASFLWEPPELCNFTGGTDIFVCWNYVFLHIIH